MNNNLINASEALARLQAAAQYIARGYLTSQLPKSSRSFSEQRNYPKKWDQEVKLVILH